MSYYILDTEFEKGVWETDTPKLIGVNVKEVDKITYESFIKKVNSSLVIEKDEENTSDHPLPKEVTIDVIKKYSAAELTVHYTKGKAVNIAKELGLKGYSKYKEEELWQFLKDSL